jgi:hypothetical protein
MQLKTLFSKLSIAERKVLADAVGTSPAYLWQLAVRWRGKTPSIAFIRKLAQADKRLKLSDLMREFLATESAEV